MKTLTKQEQRDEAHEVYLAINDPARKTYEAIAEPAYKAYEEIRVSAWKAYLAIVEPAQEAYLAIAPAWIAYQTKLREINAQPDEVETIITHNGRKYKLMEDK